MSFLQKVLLHVKPSIQEFKRFRGKINVQKPRAPNFKRQLVINTCIPKYPKDLIRINRYKADKCSNLNPRKKVVIDNPFEHILAKECLNWFNHSNMIAFIHVNSVTMEDKYEVFADLKFENMHLRTYGKKIVNMAVQGTRYEIVKPLFVSNTQIIFSETVKVQKLLQILKKLPQFIFMAGIVDGQLLSKNEFKTYANFPSLDIMRAQLCQVLEKSASKIVNQMSQHQLALVNNLDRYIELQGKENEKTKTDEPA